ncbi:SDR family oxidoreductase [Thermoclostridium caenicola]|uniref:NAD(P)-dependent dehydrogenase, short-chain alcohol dehydrogenase family n=1 Tax=Thermoclostridium caenicola TaxID=659425 RepID=A0A1M6G3G1_9FIRM|nr:SDR family oxidoreductase [Thermoclostridium caenicola]SHJ04508.1 NAD(P)-dependent dehydrogenase, short-chain alcohol dehydrogenase family [Thermoclostridium caenicola]HOL83788.1 SDR family oxidoreductase [Thermoclostridium caenicola]HPO75810.1 SDR family oxidoreductase [Thermoclostridium caenicola]
MDYGLKGKTAVVTGAGGVICGVMSKELAKQGVKVALLDILEENARKVADEITAAGGEAIALKADVLDPKSLEEACSKVVEAFGGVDFLINGAGGNKRQATTSPEMDFFHLEADAIRWVFDLNVTGAILTTQAFGKELVKKGKGCVINIASMAGYLPLTNTVAYSAAKAAVANFTKWMAVHFNLNYSKEIRVNAIAPGFLLTEQNRYLLTNPDGSSTPRGEKVIAKTPMGRYGKPEELCGALMWLLSDDASFVTGAVIPVDGGFSAYWGV